MNWVVKIADEPQYFIDRLPTKIRRQISRSIGQLEQNPFYGDVKPLRGDFWKGHYRKRVGDYRVIFYVNLESKLVDVSRVLLRSEKTYRHIR